MCAQNFPTGTDQSSTLDITDVENSWKSNEICSTQDSDVDSLIGSGANGSSNQNSARIHHSIAVENKMIC